MWWGGGVGVGGGGGRGFDLDWGCMILGKNGGVVLMFWGGGVGVIVGLRREKNWRSWWGIEEVNLLEKSDYVCVY